MNRQQGQKRTVPSRILFELLPMLAEAGVRPVRHAPNPGAALRASAPAPRAPHPPAGRMRRRR